jgi:hypothetical protein
MCVPESISCLVSLNCTGSNQMGVIASYSHSLQIPHHSRTRAADARELALLPQEAGMWRAAFQLRECGHSGLLPRTTGTTVRPADLSGCATDRGSGAQKVRIFEVQISFTVGGLFTIC